MHDEHKVLGNSSMTMAALHGRHDAIHGGTWGTEQPGHEEYIAILTGDEERHHNDALRKYDSLDPFMPKIPDRVRIIFRNAVLDEIEQRIKQRAHTPPRIVLNERNAILRIIEEVRNAR